MWDRNRAYKTSWLTGALQAFSSLPAPINPAPGGAGFFLFFVDAAVNDARIQERPCCRKRGENLTNEAENGAETPDIEDEIEGSKGKTTKLELPKVLTYDEIDRFLLAIEDLEDMIAARIMLFAGLRVGEVAELLARGVDAERCAVFVKRASGQRTVGRQSTSLSR